MIVTKKVNAIAFALDNASLVVYVDSGDVITFQQGDANIERLAPILSEELGIKGVNSVEIGILADETTDIFKSLARAGARIREMFDIVSGEPRVALIDKDNNEILPDVSNATHILADAVENGNEAGAVKFLERVGELANLRKHSAEDLMRFIKNNELPITADGDILIFKSVKKRNDERGVYYTDCHTGNVRQCIGNIVQMAPELVDNNRSIACSNGLHLASLSYASSFTGDALLLCKVRPEDIISVPVDSSGTKVRSAKYKVLAELPARTKAELNNNPEVQGLIASCVVGWEPVTNNVVTILGTLATADNVVIGYTSSGRESEKVPVRTTRDTKRTLVETGKPNRKIKQGKHVDPANIKAKRTIVGELFESYKAGKATAQEVYDSYRKNKRPWAHHEISKEDADEILKIVKGKRVTNVPRTC